MPYQLTQQRNLNFYNVKDYGAQGNGTTDDSAAITAARSAASGSGGTVFYPAGNYVAGNLPLYSNVHDVGAGIGATTLTLKAGSNTDLFSGQTGSINIGGAAGTGGAGTLYNFSIQDMSIDGNKANQSGPSYPLRFYGYGFILQNLRIRNGYSGGILSDWNGGASAGNDSMEAQVSNVKIRDCGGIGVQWGGPHDSQIQNMLSFKCDSHAFHVGPNATGMLFKNCHGWGMKQGVAAVAWLIEAPGFQSANCVGEGADTVNVVLLANKVSWQSGFIYAFGSIVGVTGVQIGQKASATLKSAATTSPITLTSALTTVAPSVFFQFVVTGAGSNSGTIVLSGTNLAGGAINETINAAGNGTYTSVNSYAAITSITITGMSGYSINVNGLGVPYSGSVNASAGLTTAVSPYGYVVHSMFSDCSGVNGTVWFANDGGNGHVQGPVYLNGAGSGSLLVQTGAVSPSSQIWLTQSGLTPDGTRGKNGSVQFATSGNNGFTITDRSVDRFNMNTFNVRAEFPNNTVIRQYSDNYSTRTTELSGGTLIVLQSTTAAATASSGTITTSGVGIARVAPTGNITAVILQAGTSAGQRVIIRNESAFTITFDVSGTSHVADGATSAIPANCSREFEWNSVGSVWSRMA